MLKKPTEILTQEHQAVLGKLDTLEGLMAKLDEKEQVIASLKELTSFFDNAFWVHFDKEERGLFPEFDNFMPRGVGPLAAMIEEHEVIRNTWEAVHEGAERYFNGDSDPLTINLIRQKGSHFIEFLRGHIQKEDGLLPRLVEMHLSRNQEDEIIQRFSDIEKSTAEISA